MDTDGYGMAKSSVSTIVPTSINSARTVGRGTGGGTSLAMQRRVQDNRFTMRYFVGNGLDVGGGQDSLALFVDLFPLVNDVAVYDAPRGDVQGLGNLDDGSFDFLFSSHCLEYVRDPMETLANWIRVVRRGGHLVISVTNEELYEQRTGPSSVNSDHKTTFTICKKSSWSPVSVSVFGLVSQFCDKVKPLSIMTTDHAYRHQDPRFDLTSTPLSECAIEFVLQKL
jgi:SAM-dependent methyltransferase